MFIPLWPIAWILRSRSPRHEPEPVGLFFWACVAFTVLSALVMLVVLILPI